MGVVLTDIPIMGLLGSYVWIFYKNSTLLGISIFSSEGTSGDIVSNLDGYDAKFDGICKAVLRAIADSEVNIVIVETAEMSAEE